MVKTRTGRRHLGRRFIEHMAHWFTTHISEAPEPAKIFRDAAPRVEDDASADVFVDPNLEKVRIQECLINELTEKYRIDLLGYASALCIHLTDMVEDLALDGNDYPSATDPILTYCKETHQAMIDTRFPDWKIRTALAMLIGRFNQYLNTANPDIRAMVEAMTHYEITADMIAGTEGPQDNAYWEDYHLSVLIQAGEFAHVEHIVKCFPTTAHYAIQRIFGMGPLEAAIALSWVESRADIAGPASVLGSEVVKNHSSVHSMLERVSQSV